ncbi:MAG: hypothetical protein DRI57_00005 [Deltaproteobacteria bacterium]|nr:MAG: hypothetical protein DRI57_00005 [Deltaproteobacteria bacterium]
MPERGVFHLGGERRPVRYCRVKADDALQEDWASASRDEVIQMIACHGRFKLFLITPGIFEGKVHPFEETGEEIFINIKEPEMRARLVGMTMNRQIPIGGWDIQKSYPKPLQRAVSDGAVYFFCIENWPESTSDRERLASKVFDALNFRSLCSGNFEKEGFGIVLIGGWHV